LLGASLVFNYLLGGFLVRRPSRAVLVFGVAARERALLAKQAELEAVVLPPHLCNPKANTDTWADIGITRQPASDHGSPVRA
jgi:hypothetical protein